MVKLVLPNLTPPDQENQKCLENKCTALVTSRRREVTKAVHLFSRHFWLSWPGGADLGKMSFTIEFVYENYKF